jgi:hypothetical protein
LTRATSLVRALLKVHRGLIVSSVSPVPGKQRAVTILQVGP